MKENKTIVIFSMCVVAVSLALAVILEWEIDKFLMYFVAEHRAFLINIFIGLFCSGVLVISVSILTYKIQKKHALNELYMEIIKYQKQVLIFSYEVLKCDKENVIKHLDSMHFQKFELEKVYIDIKSRVSQVALFSTKKNKKITDCIIKIHCLCQKIELQLGQLAEMSQQMIKIIGSIDGWFEKVLPHKNLSVELENEVSTLEGLLGITMLDEKEINGL